MTPEPKELHMVTAFGQSIDKTTILAAQPDEEELEFGPERTVVVRMAGRTASIQKIIPKPIVDSWLSTNGRAYCPSNNGEVLTFSRGEWSSEKASDRDEYFRSIWGFSGQTDREDYIFLCSNESLFLRRNGTWSEHPMPDSVQMVKRLHGLSPDEVYICSDAGLLCWNGTQLTEVDGPSEEIRGVLVLSDHEILVTGKRLHLWTDADGWKELDSPGDAKHTLAMVHFHEDALIGSLFGVLRYRAAVVEKVLDQWSNTLVNVGDGILSAGDECFLYHGDRWNRLHLPMLGFREELK